MFGMGIRELSEVRKMNQSTKKEGPGRKGETSAGEGPKYW